MVRQLVCRLHKAEEQERGKYAICITGDHSTPVLFGDHSHEPVPFTIAHIRHVVGFRPPSLLCHILIWSSDTVCCSTWEETDGLGHSRMHFVYLQPCITCTCCLVRTLQLKQYSQVCKQSTMPLAMSRLLLAGMWTPSCPGYTVPTE